MLIIELIKFGGIELDDTVNFEITIPSDDGYILLQCEHCGGFFKCIATDIEDDSILNIYCPSCGLISENYLTEDVVELAMTKAENYATNMIYNAFKYLEHQNKRNNVITFKTRKKLEFKHENSIYSSIEALEVNYYPCCKRSAKINSLLKMSASYCPFCGVKHFADE